jgi:L-seryl-tRNA(Ser) seleniumtransferase
MTTIATDRFGNRLAVELPYARGEIIGSTKDDIRKLRHAWTLIEQRVRSRGSESVFDFSGLDRVLSMTAEELAFADDEIASALYLDRIKSLALEHMGGTPGVHDAVLLNRLTAATIAVHLTLVEPGATVVGVAPSYSHPSVVRAAGLARAAFVDTRDAGAFAEVFERTENVGLVVITRLAATYDLLPLETIHAVVQQARAREVPVLIDDAGGARVGPAIFNQPRTLELGADLGVTGLDKYGTLGPRLGLLAGDAALVSQVYARAAELGLEARPMLYPAVARSLAQYSPERVQSMVTCTRGVVAELREIFGDRLRETMVAAQLPGEDILDLAMARARITQPPIVPIEATAALAMLLLQDYGMLTVHFAGLPPGNSAFLIKFVHPETLERFGGAKAFATAIRASIEKLGSMLQQPGSIRSLLFGNV